MALKQYLMHVQDLERCASEQITGDIDNMCQMALK